VLPRVTNHIRECNNHDKICKYERHGGESTCV